MTRAYALSVIVPVFDAEAFLARCVASLDAQTASQESFEVILVNDGSTDSSLELCKNFAGTRQNYQVIDQENAGVSAARNAGIGAARGRYLMFLDPDDEVSPPTVERLIKAFDSFGDAVDLVTYPLIYHDAASGKERLHKRQDWLRETGVYDLQEYPFIVQTTVNVCVRNDGARTQRFKTSHKLCEDQRFIMEVLSHKARIGFCAEASYVYWRYQDPTASLKPLTSQTFDNILENYERYVQLAHENERFARYAYALVLYEFGWRFRRKRILPEEVALEERVACSQRLAAVLEAVPESAWIESPYLSGLWVLDWAMRKKACLLVKGYFVLPAFVTSKPPRLLVSVGEEELEPALRPSACGLGKPCLEAGLGWEFSLELPRMERAPYEARLRIACEEWPNYVVDLRTELVRCNGRKLDKRIREFDDRRLSFGTDSLRVGTVKDLPLWVMPVAKRLMRVRDSFRRGRYAEPVIRELRSALPKVMRKLRGKRLWLYVDPRGQEGEGLAFQRFQADRRLQDGVERRYVSSEKSAGFPAHVNHAGETLSRESREHITWMLASERVVTSAERFEELLPCDEAVWVRLADFLVEQEYVLLTHDAASLSSFRTSRYADTICEM